jgi:hypothetical protein
MSIVGAASAIGGIISLSDSHWEQTSDGYETHDKDAFTGAIIVSVGIGLMAGGITCIAIGEKKSKKYEKALKELTLMPIVEPNKAGVMLTFRF